MPDADAAIVSAPPLCSSPPPPISSYLRCRATTAVGGQQADQGLPAGERKRGTGHGRLAASSEEGTGPCPPPPGKEPLCHLTPPLTPSLVPHPSPGPKGPSGVRRGGNGQQAGVQKERMPDAATAIINAPSPCGSLPSPSSFPLPSLRGHHHGGHAGGGPIRACQKVSESQEETDERRNALAKEGTCNSQSDGKKGLHAGGSVSRTPKG
ncbi:hypothetical protein MDA_GLEAN10013820 [Myotis davidii]|uniref:Uncharacterized protein n=1 Tax=Myotis davidii TaxID=225400 RepID=L5M7T9_MYODS|nr:hypothetical protein MDA_GLEAN10013820 [Myotis davidii]